jgi:Putative peptidoglycan binding domain/LysM domain
MSTYHTVVQGEHLSGIARKYGFSSYKTIWNHGQNAELKKKRQNPNVIFPGDLLFIPDKGEKEESRSTEKRHHFKLKTEKLKLRLVLEDLYEKPIANAKVELHIENEVFTLTTNGQGRIEEDIKATDEQGFLTIKDPQTPINEILIPIKIGDLDPVEEESGQKARLNNLGYFAGPLPEKSAEDNKAMFLSAVEEFQCDHSLVVDGKCGPSTQAKLKQEHGC